MDIKQLRREAAQRAISNEIKRLEEEQAAIIRRATHAMNLKAGAAIDSALKTPKISHDKAVTRQTQYDRLSIHDHAQNNPILLKILRRM